MRRMDTVPFHQTSPIGGGMNFGNLDKGIAGSEAINFLGLFKFGFLRLHLITFSGLICLSVPSLSNFFTVLNFVLSI